MAITIRVNFVGVSTTQNATSDVRINLNWTQRTEYQQVNPNARVNYQQTQRVEYQQVLPHLTGRYTFTQYIQRAPYVDMASEIYPELRGLTYTTSAKPMFSTDISEHTSGKETATQYWEDPKWEFKLQYDYLPNKSPAANTDFKTLAGFFMSRKGRFEPFLFKAPDDRYVERLQIGIGDGVQTEWQMYRPMGTYFEPIGQADPDNTFIYVEVQAEPHSVPGTGPYTITLDHTNIDAFYSLRRNADVWTRVSGAPAVNQYNLDEETGVVTFNASNAGNNNIFVRYRYVAELATDYTFLLPRTLVFLTAPPEDAVITGTYEFFFVVRFLDDEADFDQFMDKLWELGQIEFRSVLL